MKLTNRQLDIVSHRVYDVISKINKKYNDDILSKTKIPKRKYFEDKKEFEKLNEKIKILRDQQDKLNEKYCNKEVDNFKFPIWNSDVFTDITSEKYKKALINNLVTLKKIPSIPEIEEEIILSSNKDIPTLIEALTNKYLDN